MRIDDFFADIRVQIPGVAEPVMANALRRALKVFFQQSSAWLAWVPATMDVDGEYIVSDQSPEAVNSIQKVRPVDGDVLRPTSEETLDQTRIGWRNEKAAKPTHFYCDAQNHIFLFPKPENPPEILAQVSLYTTPASDELPDWIGEHWRDEIVDGACSYLYSRPGQPYTNAALGDDLERRLVRSASDARIKANRSHTREVRHARTTSFEEL
jgi:hypothetical protein